MEQHDELDSMRFKISYAFTHFEQSRSFDYSQIRVQTSAPSSAPVPVRDVTLKQAQFVRLVRALKPEQAAWLRYCYAKRDMAAEWADIECVSVFVFTRCLQQFEGITAEKRQRLMGFVLPALQQIQHEQNTGKRLYTTAALIELTEGTASATQACWKRDWAPFWRALCGELRNLDHKALLDMLVAVDIDRIRVKPHNRIVVNAQMRLTA